MNTQAVVTWSAIIEVGLLSAFAAAFIAHAGWLKLR